MPARPAPPARFLPSSLPWHQAQAFITLISLHRSVDLLRLLAETPSFFSTPVNTCWMSEGVMPGTRQASILVGTENTTVLSRAERWSGDVQGAGASLPARAWNSPSQPLETEGAAGPGRGPFSPALKLSLLQGQTRTCAVCFQTHTVPLTFPYTCSRLSITAALSRLTAFSSTRLTGAFTGNCFYLKFEELTLVTIFIPAVCFQSY